MEEEKVKRKVKDSVFTNLFGERKYLMQLYQALHPEDEDVTEEELADITIRNVLTNGIYNDLGFLVRERLVVLVEAQSSWTVNIIIRGMMYLMQTYHNYISSRKYNLYGSKKVEIPKPELYVIYTGERQDKPEVITLSEEFFNGQECAVDARVKVIYDGEGNNIIHQYVTFTKIYDEQKKRYGRSRQAIEETIRICKDENILKEYLESREEEVVDIMVALYDEEEVMRSYIESVKYETAQRVEKETAQRVERETAQRVEKEAAQREKETAQRVEKETAQRVEKETSVRVLVQTCQELGISQPDTIKKTAEKFGVTDKEAEKLVKTYWDVQDTSEGF